MSIQDEIGDLSGGQIHLWPGQRTEEIQAAFKVSDQRSSIELDRDIDDLLELEPEIRAAEIARNLCKGRYLEFMSETFKLASIRARTIATLTDPSTLGKAEGKTDKEVDSLVSFTGSNHVLVRYAQELAWLSYAFDAGANAADLEAWGVEPITIQQLLWWQRREGETLLRQHIRAERNGLALPWLAAAVRDTYGNLLRFVEKNAFPADALDQLADQIAQVRELLAFFEVHWSSDKPKPEPLVTLTEDEVKAWAEAFVARVDFIAPDAKGRWASLPKVSLGRGELRGQALVIAKYFKHIGVSTAEFANLPADYFGRVGDVNA